MTRDRYMLSKNERENRKETRGMKIVRVYLFDTCAQMCKLTSGNPIIRSES